MTSRQADIIVIGAGISGLATAHYLRKDGRSVTVVEKTNRVGGCIGSSQLNGFLIERGPNSIQDPTPLLRQLCSDLGLESAMQFPGDLAKNRYVVRGGRLHAVPMSPPAMIRTGLFSTRTKLGILKEPFIRPAPADAEETLAEFTSRRLGREILDYAIDPFVSGVYAGLPEELSVRAGFPRLHRLEQRYGSLIKGAILGARERRQRASLQRPGECVQSASLFSFAGGMQTLIDRLASGLTVFTNTSVRSIGGAAGGYRVVAEGAQGALRLTARRLVLAVPAYAYENFGLGLDFPPLLDLVGITYPPVTSVFFGYARDPGGRVLDGFGFLVPRRENRRILGTIWNSALFPGRAPAGGAALTTFVGGRRQPEIADLSDEELTAAVGTELNDLLGLERRPDEVVIRRWPRAIPQYFVGHQRIVDRLEAFEQKNPGLYIIGNFRGGISVGDCVERGHELSGRIKAESG